MSHEQYAKNAAEWLKDHQYTCMTDANGVEVWRCQKPGSIHLAFDICITRFGMTMFGDADSLVFNVGSGYGLDFLARNPDGYMIEKLDERYRREREFDCERFEAIVFEAITERLERELPDDHAQPECTTLEELAEWIEEQEFENELGDLVDVAGEALSIDENPVRVFDWLRDNEEALDISDTWEYRTDRPSSSLLRRLHYISHAARQILAIKADQEAQHSDGNAAPEQPAKEQDQ